MIGFCKKFDIDLGNVLLFLIFCLCVEVYDFHRGHVKLITLTEEPTVIEGTFTHVSRITQSRKSIMDGYRICLDYDDDVVYILMHRRHDKRTYGIRDNVSIDEYGAVLYPKLGYQAHIEYLQPAENTRWITRFRLEGIEYVDSEVAIDDMTDCGKGSLCFVTIAFIITIALLVFIRRCMRHQRNLE